jgi:hypothetical protein
MRSKLYRTWNKCFNMNVFYIAYFWEVKQDSQCTSNATLRRVRATIVTAEKRVLHNLCVCVCVCSLRYPACNAHAPHCHLWHVRLYNILPHYLKNGTVFGKKLLNIKCVIWFSLKLLSDTFLILRRNQWCVCACIYIYIYTYIHIHTYIYIHIAMCVYIN